MSAILPMLMWAALSGQDPPEPPLAPRREGDVEVEIDLGGPRDERSGPPRDGRPPRRPREAGDGPPRDRDPRSRIEVRRDDKGWVISGVEIFVPRQKDDEPPPWAPDAVSVEWQLEDGRKVVLRRIEGGPPERRHRPDRPLERGPSDLADRGDGPGRPVTPQDAFRGWLAGERPPQPPFPPFPPHVMGIGGPTPGKPDRELVELMQKEHQLLLKTRELREAYSSAKTDEEKEKKRAEIREVIGEHFKVRQEMRQRSVDRLKKELERLETAVEKREESRDSMIDRRLNEVLNEDAVDF